MQKSLPSGLLMRRDARKRTAAGPFVLAAAPLQRVFAAEGEHAELRVIAYNVYNCTGWPKDRALATKLGQMPARRAQGLALYEPDIIDFSESPDESVVKEIAERRRTAVSKNGGAKNCRW